MAKILIAGCGDIGMRLATRLVEKGHVVTGLRRKPVAPPHPALKMLSADMTVSHRLQALDDDFDYVVFLAAPDARDETQYRAVYETALGHLLTHFSKRASPPRWIFVSSTRVYGESQGEWVEESTPAQPKDVTGQLLYSAEQRVRSQDAGNIVVRFSGIYGPGRRRLLRLAKAGASAQRRPPYYTNRIHQEDCAGVLDFLLKARISGRTLEDCYLASDDAPAPMFEVLSWLAGRMGGPQPAVRPAGAEPVQNKRCRNDRLKALGYVFRYPSYREGYLPLIDANTNL
ncbi:MAG: SDR family oxidoreductase [Nitrospiria bacterium]